MGHIHAGLYQWLIRIVLDLQDYLVLIALTNTDPFVADEFIIIPYLFRSVFVPPLYTFRSTSGLVKVSVSATRVVSSVISNTIS